MNISSKIGAAIVAAVLAGCAASAATVRHGPSMPQGASIPGHDNMMPRSAVQAVLREYDRQIAALRATLHPAAFANSTADVNASIAALRNEIQASSDRVNTFVAQKAAVYAARQDNAVSAVLASGGKTAPSRGDVAARLEADYRNEYAQLRSGSQSDMNAYRQALLDQQRRDYATFVDDVAHRTQQAYFNRAQELREKESALLLDLARRDAPQRLLLRAKLQTLALDAQPRARFMARLSAIQRTEDRALAALRAKDAATLGAYRSTLVAQANRDVADMAAELEGRTQANLAARRDVLAAQQAQQGRLPLTSRGVSSPARGEDLRSKAAALRANDAQQLRSQAQATVAAYTAARDDIAARFADLRERDSAALQSTLAAIARLERDRAALETRLR